MSKVLLIMLTILLLSVQVNAETLFTLATKGIIFKDKLVVEVFDDPDIDGVACYVTFPKRALSFEDQTDSSISCRQIGEIHGQLTSKRFVFNKSKSIFFKKVHVDRFYDKKRNVLVYVSYTTNISGDNANNSISVVPLHK